MYNKIPFSRSIRQDGFEIVRDAPSIIYQRIKKKYEYLIKRAQQEVIIETPYFLPGYLLRKALMDAANRGVEVKIILPQHSDVRLVDVLRNKYLGNMYRNRVKFLFFKNNNLHAKMLMIDNRIFSIGSANFDYRSFRYMHEICIVGKDESILQQLKEHVKKNLKNCMEFDYPHWKNRPLIEKFFESLLIPFRHLF